MSTLYPPQPFELWYVPFWAIMMIVICMGLGAHAVDRRESNQWARLLRELPLLLSVPLSIGTIVGYLAIVASPVALVVELMLFGVMAELGAPPSAIIVAVAFTVGTWSLAIKLFADSLSRHIPS